MAQLDARPSGTGDEPHSWHLKFVQNVPMNQERTWRSRRANITTPYQEGRSMQRTPNTAMPTGPPLTILLADDDADDRMMASEALAEARIANPLVCVEDGGELLDYLLGTGPYAGARPPLPGLILLDLNMPRVDGREALCQLKQHPELRRIPVIVLTTSKAEKDIRTTYDLGVNSFITKPVSFNGLVDVMRGLGHYWLEIVELPAA